MTVAAAWFYQGLVPKLLARDADELSMLSEAGIPDVYLPQVLWLVGSAELLFGAVVLIFFRHRWPLALTILFMVLATVGVAVNSPRFLTAAFNPVTLNMLLAAVAAIGLIVSKDLPSARRCLRKRPESD